MIDFMSYLPWLLILFYVIAYFLYLTFHIFILLIFNLINTFVTILSEFLTKLDILIIPCQI